MSDEYDLMYDTIETVTPAAAKAWVALNHEKQRRVKKSHVKELARRMGSGEWGITPQQVVFDVDGKLIDGQHTLNAVIEHGSPVRLRVTREAPREVFTRLDSGVKRTNSDHTGIPRKKLETATNLYRIAFGKSGGVVSPDIAYRSYIAIEDEIDTFFNEVTNGSSNRKGICSQVRTGAIASLIDGADLYRLSEDYANFYQENVSLLPPVLLSFYKMVVKGEFAISGEKKRYSKAILSYKAFSSEYRDAKKLVATDRDIERMQRFLVPRFIGVESREDVAKQPRGKVSSVASGARRATRMHPKDGAADARDTYF